MSTHHNHPGRSGRHEREEQRDDRTDSDGRRFRSHGVDSRGLDSDGTDSRHLDSRGRRDGHERSDAVDRTDRRQRTKSAAPSYPDASRVGPHLVVDKTEWVPGEHPETHLGYDGQRGYAESYYRCILCGAERQSERGFPPECDPDA